MIDITIFIPQQILTLYTYVIKISVVPDGWKITFLRWQENSANSRQKIIDCKLTNQIDMIEIFAILSHENNAIKYLHVKDDWCIFYRCICCLKGFKYFCFYIFYLAYNFHLYFILFKNNFVDSFYHSRFSRIKYLNFISK